MLKNHISSEHSSALVTYAGSKWCSSCEIEFSLRQYLDHLDACIIRRMESGASQGPEKCPIQTCVYHQRGFQDQSQKDRHTITHYDLAGVILVCSFCTELLFSSLGALRAYTLLNHFDRLYVGQRKCAICGINMGPFCWKVRKHIDDCILKKVEAFAAKAT